ncbi:MAG: hypothetical protein KDC83_15720, partial [Flavobacteriales bacterium]|nr:hypothetical protein [Flavobacteriales bacterium]
MARKKKTGVCQICGKQGKLSFEHVPNKKALNSATIIEYTFEDVFIKKDKSKGHKVQGGIGQYTLCEQCNNDTGSWYGDEFTIWSCNCMDFLYQRSLRLDFSDEAVVTLLNVYPLRFLKQVVVCFFSVSPGLAQQYPELVKFVKDKYEQHTPEGCNFYINFHYSTTSPTLRRWPLAGVISVQQEGKKIIPSGFSVICEIAHPPFQLIMTLGAGYHKKAGYINIFNQYDYDQQDNVTLKLGV